MINRGISGRVKLSLYPAVIAFFTYCNWNIEAFAILAVLIVIDFFLWITKVWAIHGGKSITSSKARTWLLSKLIVILIPIIVGVAGRVVWLELSVLVTTVAWALVLSELYSIIWNISAIRLWQEIAEFDAISFTLKKILGLIKWLLEKYL